MDLNTVILGTIAISIALFLYRQWLSTYWQRCKIPCLNHDIFLTDVAAKLHETYTALKAKNLGFGGIFLFSTPVFVPVDLGLLKNIMQKDFDHFFNRHAYVNEKAEPLSVNLFSIKDDAWKSLRTKLTPVFSSAKLKMMFETLADTSVSFADVLDVHAKTNEPVFIRDLLSRFTSDAIASCAFGINSNSIQNPNSEFHHYGTEFMESLGKRILLSFLIPHSILTFFNISLMASAVQNFFINAVKNIVEHREKNNIFRKDMMHLLIQLKNRGEVTNDDRIMNDQGRPGNFSSINQVAAQCFVFFVAGFETSAVTMTMALSELALNQDIQDKLREEIRSELKENDGKLTYDGIMRMKYLDNVLNETLRKHTAVKFMVRKCNKDYKIPNSEAVIKKGTSLLLPFHEIHKDPEYYADPEKFNPERFDPENRSKIPQFAFLPFGEGPRACIGARFGKLQSKVGIIAIIKDFRVTINAKTRQPIEHDKGVASSVKGGLWLNVEKVE